MKLLQSKICLLFILSLLCCLRWPQPVFPESAIECHCFKARAYNPADRFAADEYILATCFNSLLAKVFNIPKSKIIMIKMNEGVSQDELLISLKLSEITGEDPSRYFRQRQENVSWPQIIFGLTQPEAIRKDAILQAVMTGIPAEEAGARIADDMIGAFYGIAPDEIRKLKASGLNEKEINLVVIRGHSGDQKSDVQADKHEKQGMSWSEIANVLGLEPAAAGELILTCPAGRKAEEVYYRTAAGIKRV